MSSNLKKSASTITIRSYRHETDQRVTESLYKSKFISTPTKNRSTISLESKRTPVKISTYKSEKAYSDQLQKQRHELDVAILSSMLSSKLSMNKSIFWYIYQCFLMNYSALVMASWVFSWMLLEGRCWWELIY